MKKIITSILCLMAFISASADEYLYFFNVKTANDAEAVLTIPLTDSPVITYERGNNGNNMIVKSNGNSPYVLDTKEHYVFYYSSDETSSIISKALSESSFSKSGQVVTVSGVKANEVVSVYSANGAKVAEVTADANGVAVIDFTPLPKGVVVMKSPGASFKIAH